MRVSRLLRNLHLHVLLPLLPGVRRDPDRPDSLRVDPRIARLLPVEVFHLFGYRKRRPEGAVLRFTRRREADYFRSRSTSGGPGGRSSRHSGIQSSQ